MVKPLAPSVPCTPMKTGIDESPVEEKLSTQAADIFNVSY